MTKYAITGALPMPMRRLSAQRFSNSERSWFWLPILGMIVFGLLYIFVVNHTAAQGYEVRELERRIEELRRDTKSMELRAAELQSMESIGSRLSNAEFVPVIQVQYLRAGAPAVARK